MPSSRTPFQRQQATYSSSFLLRNALALITAGLCLGLAVPPAPHPRLALAPAPLVQCVVNGLLGLVLGLLLSVDYLRLTGAQLAVVRSAGASAWVPLVLETLDAYWGTAQTLPVATNHAGISFRTAGTWQDVIMKIGHVVPSALMILALVIMTISAFKRHREAFPIGRPVREARAKGR